MPSLTHGSTIIGQPLTCESTIGSPSLTHESMTDLKNQSVKQGLILTCMGHTRFELPNLVCPIEIKIKPCFLDSIVESVVDSQLKVCSGGYPAGSAQGTRSLTRESTIGLPSLTHESTIGCPSLTRESTIGVPSLTRESTIGLPSLTRESTMGTTGLLLYSSVEEESSHHTLRFCSPSTPPPQYCRGGVFASYPPK